MKTFNLFAAFLSLTVSPAWASDCEDVEARFAAVQKSYFARLDYEVHSASKMAKFEREVTRITDCALHLNSRESALPLIYGALVLKNNSQGAAGGYIPLATLTKYKKYSEGRSLKQEIAARQERAVQLFHIARARNPEDRRIPGWIAGATVGLEYWRDGAVSDTAFRNMMREAQDYPEFNLLTALLAFHGLPLRRDQELELLAESEKMLDIKEGPCSPLNSEADPVCKNGPKAPYNFQNSIAMMIDTLLNEGVHLANTGVSADRKASLPLGFKSKIVAGITLLPNEMQHTLGWSKKELLFDRMKVAGQVIASPKDAKAKWESGNWRSRAFQCASCHSPNQ